MKYPKLDLGKIEAIVNKLGGMEGVKLFLSGQKILIDSEKSKIPIFQTDVLLNYRSKGGDGSFTNPKWNGCMEIEKFVGVTLEKFSGELAYEVLPEKGNFYKHYQKFGDTLLKSPSQIVREIEYIWTCNFNGKDGEFFTSVFENPRQYGLVWYFKHDRYIYNVVLESSWCAQPYWLLECCPADPGPGSPRQLNVVFHNNGLKLF